jgi:pantothenate kinase
MSQADSIGLTGPCRQHHVDGCSVESVRAYSTGVDTMEELIDAGRELAGRGGRRILGIAGAPGSGKSTLAENLVTALGEEARLVSMDGFHLAQAELARLGRADRKGAPDTFDPWGFVALLRRLRDASDEVVYAPRFDRDLEEPIAGAVRIDRDVPLVVAEGNYLLVEDAPWHGIRPLLDVCWFLRVDPGLRRRRLAERHRRHGRSASAAREWVRRVDEPNALRVEAGYRRADRVIE